VATDPRDRDPDPPLADEPYAHTAAEAWVHRSGVLSLARARIMGVLNVTPDSFYDGGQLMPEGARRPNVAVVVRRGRQLVEQGAAILDVGGESTRPGAAPVAPEDEIARVVPVIEALVAALGREVPISVDTRRARVAALAVEAGASIVNDVSGAADPEMLGVVAASGAGLVLGHLRGEPRTMQAEIRFAHALREVTDELAAGVDRAVAAGIERPRMLVDPGIGFGKTSEQSAALVAAAGWLREATGCAVLIGASRKSFLGAITGRPAGQRLLPSVIAAIVAADRGAAVLRVHDVAETAEALAVARAIQAAFEAAERGESPA
jgi:dihydropteroate synthase